MKSSLTLLAAAAAAALSFAVGSAPASATPSNPFAGSWCGTFELVGDEDPAIVGTVEWTISSSGVITGSFYNTTLDVPGTMRGRVSPDGSIGLNPNVYGPGPGGQGGNGEHHAGTATLDGDTMVASTTGVWHTGYAVVATLSRCDD